MSAATRTPGRRGIAILAAVAVGLVTAAFRFLATTGFNNDHFVHLSAAQQLLFGDWPTRDFIDVGRPLTIVASAVAQHFIGHTLFAEALLVSAAFGIAAALTVITVFELTGSLPLALCAAVLEVAIFPRTYAYPKVLSTALNLWLICLFVRNPTVTRQTFMAAGTTIAFLFRHDLGVFVGLGGLVASVLVPPGAPRHSRVRSGIAFAAMVVTMVAPYLLYVEFSGGLGNYVATTLDANSREAGYVWPNPFAAGAGADSRLLYVFHLLPLVALMVLVNDWRRIRDRWQAPFLISIIVVAITENFGLMRDLLEARIPDAVVPAAFLLAWLAHRSWQVRPRYLVAPAAIVLIWVGLLMGSVGNIRENIARTGVAGWAWLHPGLLRAQFLERSAALKERFGRDSPSRVAFTLRPFFGYLERCTTERHRLFLGGMLPEVAYLAHRPFAGGGYEHYNFRSEVNQQRVVNRLRQQLVPLALIPSVTEDQLEHDLPLIASYLRQRYTLLADLPVVENERIRILIDRELPFAVLDAETGWPCFHRV